MENIYNIFNEFMNTFDLYPHEVPGYPGYTCDRMGNVYRPDGTKSDLSNHRGMNKFI